MLGYYNNQADTDEIITQDENGERWIHTGDLGMVDEDGFVQLTFNKNNVGRQLVQEMYEFNGAVYVMNVQSLLEKGMGGFTKRVKYIMSKEHSVDIDDIYDFYQVEAIIKHR